MTTILSVDEIIRLIQGGIERGEAIDFFTPYYKILSQRTTFIASTMKNEFVYRARRAKGEMFTHTRQLRYPDEEFATKGRLNDRSEQIAYMSLGEIGPIAELDLDYYELFCMTKIKHFFKETIFHYAGVKGTYETSSQASVEVNNFYMNLLTSKGSKFYNATISLGRHLLSPLMKGETKLDSGILYNSVHQDKTNKSLYNIAVNREVFDRCFKIEEAIYYVMTYDPKQEAIILCDINKGQVRKDGIIVWQKPYEEMIVDFNKQFSNKVFLIAGGNGIVHGRHGSGKIKDKNDDGYLVAFRTGDKIVSKNEITN